MNLHAKTFRPFRENSAGAANKYYFKKMFRVFE